MHPRARPNHHFAFWWNVRQNGSHFINQFIYVWVNGIHPDSATRLARLTLVLANCWHRVDKGDWGSDLLCTTSCGDQPYNDWLIYIMSPQAAQSYRYVRLGVRKPVQMFLGIHNPVTLDSECFVQATVWLVIFLTLTSEHQGHSETWIGLVCNTAW